MTLLITDIECGLRLHSKIKQFNRITRLVSNQL